MTRTISLIIGIATVALVVGVPTALGEGRLAGSPEPAPAVAPDWFERAADRAINGDAAISSAGRTRTTSCATSSNGYLDAAGRAQRIDVVVPTALTDSFERSAPPAGSGNGSSVTASGGSDRDLSQLGTGFGIGLVLALGLFLTMRYTRGRELAH